MLQGFDFPRGVMVDTWDSTLSSTCDVLCGLTVCVCSRGGCLQGGAGGNQGPGERMPQTHQDVGPVRGREEGDGMSKKVSHRRM